MAAAAALTVDLPVAWQLKQWNRMPVVHAYLGYFDMFEPFGQGMLGTSLVLMVIHQLDPARALGHPPRAVACTLLAGGSGRPAENAPCPHCGRNDFAFDGSVWTTFGQWLPLLRNSSQWQSFPSGHTATAAGLAAALVWLYPSGRVLFPLLAVLVGCQRIVSGAHYPQRRADGGGGRLSGGAVAAAVGRLPMWFARWEDRWRTK